MKPLHVYDGDCGFCRRWISHWQLSTGDRVDYAPYQEVAHRFPDIPAAQFKAAVHLIEPGGRVSKGAEAVLRTLAYAPEKRWMLWMYRHVPGLKFFLELAYRVIARHRTKFSSLTQWLWGNHVGPASHQMTRWIFLRMLGCIYLIAFASLVPQIHGLIGQNGILPVQELLDAAGRQLGGDQARHLFPTLFWLNASDPALTFVCLAGIALSAALIIGLAQLPALIGLWICYLSLTIAGQEFLSFQWDILLLETGFLAIFFCPLRWTPAPPARETPPSQAILWLLRWLLFRLMFGSGMVKLASGDSAWANLTALTYHYQTQPLPTPLSWYFHQMPTGFHVFCAAFMFIVELLVPFLIFAPRRLRVWGCGIMIFFQIFIFATGNYAFFNILTIALCLLLLDDAVWPAWIRRLLRNEKPEPLRPFRWRAAITIPVAIMILFLSITPSLKFRSMDESGILVQSYRWLAPFRLVNSFGLFAVMTTRRPEIIIEGSRDGRKWLAYEFKYKPGDVRHPPSYVAPHQPRLDWQMWFAALSNARANRWFMRLAQRLLEGSPEVTGLLKKNPFVGGPPRYIRATLYDYRFATPGERARDGAWWHREEIKPYCPILSL
ncbi:MAG: lipase maturation factor family protein [Candidatus Omnitrophica bacterium]|nr:lipase maturation factor family protein [Candidatus Omnitrophota bacterium]